MVNLCVDGNWCAVFYQEGQTKGCKLIAFIDLVHMMSDKIAWPSR